MAKFRQWCCRWFRGHSIVATINFQGVDRLFYTYRCQHCQAILEGPE